jgi:hypothetical protein
VGPGHSDVARGYYGGWELGVRVKDLGRGSGGYFGLRLEHPEIATELVISRISLCKARTGGQGYTPESTTGVWKNTL